MTVAERKRAQRERDRQAVDQALHDEHNVPMRVLLAVLARVESGGVEHEAAQRVWAEIGRRYGFVMVTPRARSLKKHREDTDGE